MKINLIVPWPSNCDYPVWREMIKDNLDRFHKIIIVFTEAGTGYDYRSELVEYLTAISPRVIVEYSPEVGAGEDWRDVATRHALTFINNGWVWFTEQDFLPLPGFFDEVDLRINEGADVVAVYQGDRMHPCSIFIEKHDLDDMKLDFGIDPGVSDHFYNIAKQIHGSFLSVHKLNSRFYFHYNGLSHNFRLVSEGQPPVYKPDEFAEFMSLCLNADVPMSDEFKNTANEGIKLSQDLQ